MTINQIVTTEDLSQINAYVAENSKYCGDFVSDPSQESIGLKVDGDVQGSIRMPAGGIIHIGPTGKVSSKDGVTIEADLIYIEGNVDGKIVARKGIELASGSTVRGEIEYHQGISTHKLARLRASIRYAGDER